ncbi:kinase-like domain-containing protein, partial [Mycena maculata]
LQRFLEEATILCALDHPNIVGFVGVLDGPDRFGIVMPWMENGELNFYLRQHPTVPKTLLARQVVEGLKYLRQQWIVHGDLKGANILIDEIGCAHISDFGSARVLCFTDHHSEQLRGSTGGTCRWMAPELLAPSRFGETSAAPTFESDVFAFGMVLYEATRKIWSGGCIPFHDQSNSMAANLAIVAGDRLPRPSHTPDDIWDLATACWRHDPVSRPTISSIIF